MMKVQERGGGGRGEGWRSTPALTRGRAGFSRLIPPWKKGRKNKSLPTDRSRQDLFKMYCLEAKFVDRPKIWPFEVSMRHRPSPAECCRFRMRGACKSTHPRHEARWETCETTDDVPISNREKNTNAQFIQLSIFCIDLGAIWMCWLIWVQSGCTLKLIMETEMGTEMK